MVNVLLIGCGNWGTNIAASLSNLGVLYQVTDLDEVKAETVSKRFRAPVADLNNIFLDDDIDAVCIAVPYNQAEHLAKKFLKAKKPVFIEKPIATSIEKLDSLLDVAKSNNQYIMAGHLLLFHQTFIQLREIVQSGYLGKVRFIHSRREGFGKFFSDTNVIWDYGPHDISMILSLVEGHYSEIEVCSFSTSLTETIDQCSAHLLFPNNISARIDLSRVSLNKVQTLDIFCEKGMIRFCDTVTDVRKKIQILKYEKTISNCVMPQETENYYPKACSTGMLPLDSQLEFFVNQIPNANYSDINALELKNITGLIEKI